MYFYNFAKVESDVLFALGISSECVAILTFVQKDELFYDSENLFVFFIDNFVSSEIFRICI